MIKKYFIVLIALILCNQSLSINNQKIYVCTASDEQYFPCLINLIGSLHKHNFSDISQIAVFDLGLAESQKQQLAAVENLEIYSIELTHPDLLKRFNTRTWGKPVPGWYAWKAVLIKQAFDLFGFDSIILYIDAGTTILNDLSVLFAHLEDHGYFFHNGSPWDLNRETTNFVKNFFDLHNPSRIWLLDPAIKGLEAGFMGLTNRVYETFVRPMYELTKDLRYFADDGSCLGGFGNSRHDIPLFSLYALFNGYKIHHHFEQPRDIMYLDIKGQPFPFHIACNAEDRIPATNVYCARFDVNPAEMIPFIHCKSVAS